MDFEIDTLARKINRERQKPNIDPAVEEWTQQMYMDILQDYELITGDRGFQTFLLGYLRDERESLHSPDGSREDPLCECLNSECPVKQARLPRQIHESESVLEGVLEYREQHATPVVLIEAVEEWNQLKGSVKSRMSRVLVALQRNQLPADLDRDGSSPELVRS